MTVPDTNTFSLQDVVNVVNPSSETLQGCFDDAVDSLFDTRYNPGLESYKLSNFRNYGAIETLSFSTLVKKSAFINSLWDDNDADRIYDESEDCDFPLTYPVSNHGPCFQWAPRAIYPGLPRYSASRTILRFDLSEISDTETITSARLIFPNFIYSGVWLSASGDAPFPVIVKTRTSDTFGTFDWGNLTSDIMFSSKTSGDRIVCTADSTDLSYIESKLGGYLDIAVITMYDYISADEYPNEDSLDKDEGAYQLGLSILNSEDYKVKLKLEY